jgi:hypothetical protein
LCEEINRVSAAKGKDGKTTAQSAKLQKQLDKSIARTQKGL